MARKGWQEPGRQEPCAALPQHQRGAGHGAAAASGSSHGDSGTGCVCGTLLHEGGLHTHVPSPGGGDPSPVSPFGAAGARLSLNGTERDAGGKGHRHGCVLLGWLRNLLPLRGGAHPCRGCWCLPKGAPSPHSWGSLEGHRPPLAASSGFVSSGARCITCLLVRRAGAGGEPVGRSVPRGFALRAASPALPKGRRQGPVPHPALTLPGVPRLGRRRMPDVCWKGPRLSPPRGQPDPRLGAEGSMHRSATANHAGLCCAHRGECAVPGDTGTGQGLSSCPLSLGSHLLLAPAGTTARTWCSSTTRRGAGW